MVSDLFLAWEKVEFFSSVNCDGITALSSGIISGPGKVSQLDLKNTRGDESSTLFPAGRVGLLPVALSFNLASKSL
jgi:hypothetical protein